MTRATTPVGLAHLSFIDLAPPDLADLAHSVGFDFIGVRVRPATSGEAPYDLSPGSELNRLTTRRLSELNLTVVDVEALALTPDVTRDEWLAVLDAGASLGARTVSVVGADPDLQRFASRLATFTQDAHAVGLEPTLEPIAYQSVNSFPLAASLAAEAGCSLLVDTLHVLRTGTSVHDLEVIGADAVASVQLCDALNAPPTPDPDMVLPIGMASDGSAEVLESRANRLPPGEGTIDLPGIIAAAGRESWFSVEAPNQDRRRTLGTIEYARSLLKSGRAAVSAGLELANGS